jgi:hypothetical protein
VAAVRTAFAFSVLAPPVIRILPGRYCAAVPFLSGVSALRTQLAGLRSSSFICPLVGPMVIVLPFGSKKVRGYSFSWMLDVLTGTVVHVSVVGL